MDMKKEIEKAQTKLGIEQLKRYQVNPITRQCLHELSANSSPNSDTTDVYRSDKSI